MKVSKFKNVKTPTVETQLLVDDVLYMIKNGYTKDNVIAARKFQKGSTEFKRLKESTPTWTPNARFKKKRRNSDLQQLSGLMYIDVDDNINIESVYEIPSVYATWKSFSNTGYGLLIKVENLTTNNFTSTWYHLANELISYGIIVDPQTKDIPRQNIISFDEDIYINEYCTPIDATSTADTDEYPEKVEYPFNEEWDAKPQVWSSFDNTDDWTQDKDIIYETTLSDYENQDYLIIEEGKAYRTCFLPKSIIEGNRHRWLSGYIISLLFNNVTITQDTLIKLVMKANQRHMIPTKSLNEVKSLVDFYYKLHLEGNLIYNARFKKIWFDPNSSLTTLEKRKIVGKEVGKLRRNKTLSKLQSNYEELLISHQKVTQKMLSSKSGYSIRTVKNYWTLIIKG